MSESAVWQRWRAGGLEYIVPETPVPLPAACQEQPLDADERILEGAFRRFLGRLDTRERSRIVAWANHVLEGRFALSTACSGTELPTMALSAFARVAAADLG